MKTSTRCRAASTSSLDVVDASRERDRNRIATPSFRAGFFQTLASLKIREFYEKLSGVEVEVEAPAKVAA